MFSLDSSISVYVPSTTDRDRPISMAEHNTRALETARYLGDIFGGATIYNALGFWQGITENIKIVVSFADSQDLTEHYDRVIDHVATLCGQWSQESIAVEIDHNGDHKLLLVETADHKITIS